MNHPALLDLAFWAAALLWLARSLSPPRPSPEDPMTPSAIAKLVHILYKLATDPAFKADYQKLISDIQAVSADAEKAVAAS